MKKRYILAVIGATVLLVAGLFGFAHWFFIPFENRDSHNGVGYGAFHKSILHHVKQGPNSLSDLKSYEGTWWFVLTDKSTQKYNVTLSRQNYADPRDMETLKSGSFYIKAIGDKKLQCQNNFGENVRVSLSVSDLVAVDGSLTSLNDAVSRFGPKVVEFGESLPQTYSVIEGGLKPNPELLSLNFKRCASRCGAHSEEDVVSIKCELTHTVNIGG
jgi:hypothetical protein